VSPHVNTLYELDTTKRLGCYDAVLSYSTFLAVYIPLPVTLTAVLFALKLGNVTMIIIVTNVY